MNRKNFLKTLALFPVAGVAAKVSSLGALAALPNMTERMPVLFLGHGSPMNAIEENEFVRGFRKIAATLPKPKAILCISAHWETRGTFVTAMKQPKTIHDFGGFPKELFAVQYPAPGSPSLASETKKIITKTTVGLDQNWGLDHGAWSVIKHFYPKADVPVVELSMDYTQKPAYHYDLARELYALRQKGILIIGSGNLVHNLGMVNWENMNTPDYAYDWAREAQHKINRLILEGDHKSLINYRSLGKVFENAVPTPEHFLPLLYALSLKNENEKISLFNDKAVAGSLTMTSVKIG